MWHLWQLCVFWRRVSCVYGEVGPLAQARPTQSLCFVHTHWYSLFLHRPHAGAGGVVAAAVPVHTQARDDSAQPAGAPAGAGVLGYVAGVCCGSVDGLCAALMVSALILSRACTTPCLVSSCAQQCSVPCWKSDEFSTRHILVQPCHCHTHVHPVTHLPPTFLLPGAV